MKSVILIGDSIRMGYQTYVERQLAGFATVWGPEKNGETSQNVLANLEEWVLAQEADIVHLNAGLHDIKRQFGASRGAAENAVPVEAYRKNLDKIIATIKQKKPGVRLVWATTTPVNYHWHHEEKGFDRYEEDVENYNLVAVELARKHGVEVNDLYRLVMRSGRDRLLVKDGVHFNEEGYKMLGKAVAECLKK